MCSRRVDAPWAREAGAVRANRGRFNKVISLSGMLDLEYPYPERGPYPNEDWFGMKIACLLLLRSLDPGFNAGTNQYETIRGLRSHYSNFVRGAGRIPIRLDRRDILCFGRAVIAGWATSGCQSGLADDR
jgi:hypothetical protein